MPISHRTDPADVVRDVHLAGRALEFERIRVDRSQWLSSAKCWFEVGYSHEEITLRFSDGSIVRSHPDRVDYLALQQKLRELMEGVSA